MFFASKATLLYFVDIKVNSVCAASISVVLNSNRFDFSFPSA